MNGTLTQHRWVHHGTILECDDESWDFSFNLNVKSMFHVCKAVLPQVVLPDTCMPMPVLVKLVVVLFVPVLYDC